MRRLIRPQRYWLLLIIVLALIIRLYKITSPILDLYPMRQEQCAMIARNFFRYGINILNPQIDWFGNGNPFWSFEFPLISILSAVCYHLLGVKEWAARLIAVFFSLGSIIFLYQIVRILFERRTALFAALVFSVLPLSIYFSRTFMPESLMIFFSLGTVLSSYHWLIRGQRRWFLSTILFATFTFLTKLPALYILSIVVYLAFLRSGFKFILQKDFLSFLVLSLTLTALWYSRMCIPAFDHLTAIPTVLKYLSWNEFYLRIFERLSIFVLTPLGIPLFALGFLIRPKNLEQGLIYVWFFTLLFYVLRTPDMNYIHFYYQLPFVPVVSIFIARALSKTLERNFWEQTLFYHINPRLIVSVILILITASALIVIQPFYNWNRITYNVGKLIKADTPKDALLIAGRCSGEGPLYYTERRGWEINEKGKLSYRNAYRGDDFPETHSEIELIELLIGRGADYYFTTNLEAFKSSKILEDYMHSHFEIFRKGEGYIIFNLNKRKPAL